MSREVIVPGLRDQRHIFEHLLFGMLVSLLKDPMLKEASVTA